jgi:hypothetical protein
MNPFEWIDNHVIDPAEDAIKSVIHSGEEFLGYLGELFTNIGEGIADIATQLWDSISKIAGGLWGFFKWIKEKAGDVWEWTKGAMTEAWDWVREKAGDFWDIISGAAETIWGAINTAFKAIEEFIKENVLPFLLKVLWVIAHLDKIIFGFFLGLWCTINHQGDKEYDVLEGMFNLDSEAFRRRNVAFLPVSNKYVVFSDHHLFVAGDPNDKFRKMGNHELYKWVLSCYYMDGYTLIENGDVEDLWMREVTLENALMDTTIEIVRYIPIFGPLIENDYENNRIRSQAFKIFDNNADVYQFIRNLYHDEGRFIRLVGNHDDYWGSNDFLPELQFVYPGLEVFDYAFIGNYGTDKHQHLGVKPFIIIAHGHKLDDWNNSICSLVGEWATEVGSGIGKASNSVPLTEWDPKFKGSGFDNVLGESAIENDEVDFYDTVEKDFSKYPYIPHFILGHSHTPRQAPMNPDWKNIPDDVMMPQDIRCFSEYTNEGTTGRWEQFIWCATIENGNVSLYGWTWGPDGKPHPYKFLGENQFLSHNP